VVSGFFPGWQASTARNAPTVIHSKAGDTNTTLIGINTTFRGHPENTFRLLGNALFDGID